MRLLIYLLAMMTGFSAAEAARPVSATQAAVAQGAVIVASVALVEREIVAKSTDNGPALITIAVSQPVEATSVINSSPVLRHDITRQ